MSLATDDHDGNGLQLKNLELLISFEIDYNLKTLEPLISNSAKIAKNLNDPLSLKKITRCLPFHALGVFCV